MKRAFLFFCCLLALGSFARAHIFSAPTLDWLPHADAIYLTKVISTSPGHNGEEGGPVAFQIVEVLQGKPSDGLILSPYPSGEDYKKDSLWILLHNPTGFKGGVGWAMKGDCEWLPIQVTGKGDKQTAKWLGPLSSVREYIKAHPYKP